MPAATLMQHIAEAVIMTPFVALAAIGINLFLLWTISQFVGLRTEPGPVALPSTGQLPRVLIQLPVYNEANVVARVMRAAAGLDWPASLLRIQLLDDSTDGTSEVAAAVVETLQARGVDIEHVRRADRRGYKAGALANGLTRDDSPFVAIFDADFVPARDFLMRAMPPLVADPGLAFVQARWEHLNPDQSRLTASQAMMIDAHFVVEQRVRSNTELVLPFNGTCGIWRRAAIDSAGGWSSDTLCEDLDLSIRARLAGWRGMFVNDLSVPGELPGTLAGWRAQQFRWTKGFVQVARKLLIRVWRSDLPLSAKLALTMQTCQAACYPLTVMSVLASLAIVVDRGPEAYTLSMFGGIVAMIGIGGSALCLATAGVVLKRRHWVRFPIDFLTVLLLNAGLMVSNSRAVFEALIGSRSAFVRTPKQGALGDAPGLEKSGPSGAAELMMGCGLGAALAYEAGWLSPLFSLSIAGLVIVGAGLARERMVGAIRRMEYWRARQRTGDQPAE